MKLAVQDLSASSVTVPSAQSASPVHPAKNDPDAAVAIRTTTVPLAYVSEQSPGQLMPLGVLLTVPLPVPDRVIDSVRTTIPVATKSRPLILLVPTDTDRKSVV